MTTNPYAIKKNIPLPRAKPGRADGPLSTALKSMEVGDCFDYPHKTPKGIYPAAKKHGIKVAVRRTGPTSLRVWRVS